MQFMKSNQSVKKIELLWPRMIWLAIILAATAFQGLEAATNLVIWDTGSRFGEAVDAEKRSEWKAVPSELFVFEADPPKAASDPGYYGREYSFKGDAVVENRSLTAVFWSARGRVVLYSKENANGGDSPGSNGFGKKVLEFVPRQPKAQPGKITRCEILRNAGDEVLMAVS